MTIKKTNKTVPTSFQRLIDTNEDPIECRKCGSENTWGDWDSDVSYDDGYPQLMTRGEAMCADCGYAWKL